MANEVVLYKTEDGQINFEVKIVDETVWLSQKQMAELFEINIPAISKHIKNIYSTNELVQDLTISKMETVRKEGNRNIVRWVDYYNLDMIIAIGYRVNSKTATEFRKWATSTLKQHIIEGYTINEKRLKQRLDKLEEMARIIDMISRTSEEIAMTDEQVRGLLKVINEYRYSMSLFEKYDNHELEITEVTKVDAKVITYEQARVEIDRLKKHNNSELFGNEKDDSFKSAISTIYQTFGGEDLYPSIEEKAANLLYMIVKNHVAESKSEEKDTIIKLVVNLINKNN
ncbi:MAG: hypothetical protein A2Y24_02030 [Clostridiales bacterium GWE2_32_10]|nr:MAG: hypothetical protein A2Y24_02030 [Clostridiales bacterium GWE2_32_10]HBY20180.1 cytochrome C biogenesis protein CycH [Clostridiales bacterium]